MYLCPFVLYVILIWLPYGVINYNNKNYNIRV